MPGYRPFSSCTLTEEGFTHITPFGSRLPMFWMRTSAAAARKMGSVERSLTRLRYPLPRSGSFGYQWPLHLLRRAVRTACSKACTSELAKSCCVIFNDHQCAAWWTSSEQSPAPFVGLRVGEKSGAWALSCTSTTERERESQWRRSENR